jgi:hypothetical protein
MEVYLIEITRRVSAMAFQRIVIRTTVFSSRLLGCSIKIPFAEVRILASPLHTTSAGPTSPVTGSHSERVHVSILIVSAARWTQNIARLLARRVLRPFVVIPGNRRSDNSIVGTWELPGITALGGDGLILAMSRELTVRLDVLITFGSRVRVHL